MSSDPTLGRQRLTRTARRAQLIAAAQEVFSHGGYHATAMDEIAVAAGVSKPVLYQHFPGKLDLYLAVLDSLIGHLVSTVESAITAGGDTNKERIKATIAAYFAFVDRDDQPFRLVFESDLTSEPAVSERMKRLDHQLASMYGDVIVADTGMGRSHAHLLGAALSGMAQTTARQWLSSGREPRRDEAVELLYTLAWRGIRSLPVAEEIAQERDASGKPGSGAESAG